MISNERYFNNYFLYYYNVKILKIIGKTNKLVF